MRAIEVGVLRLVDEDRQALVACSCDACGHVAFPARFFCPACGRSGPFHEVLLHRGQLCAFTVCHVAPAGFDAPYVAAWVAFPEGPTVFGVVRPQEGQTLSPGDPVEVAVAHRESGVGWEFYRMPGQEHES